MNFELCDGLDIDFDNFLPIFTKYELNWFAISCFDDNFMFSRYILLGKSLCFLLPNILLICTLVSIINQELQMLNDWFKCNKLFLNFKKTKYVLFHSKRKRIPLNIDSIRIENNVIERTESINFLGILIHESLEWKHHIANISSKLSRSIGVLSKLRHFLPMRS